MNIIYVEINDDDVSFLYFILIFRMFAVSLCARTCIMYAEIDTENMKKINKRILLLIFTTLMVLMIAVISYGVVMYYSSDVKIQEGSTIIMVPVYGQSLALGEETQPVTDFDSLSTQYHHKVLSVNLDEQFGYFSSSIFKQNIKKLIRTKKHRLESSVYGVGEYTAARWLRIGDRDSLISVFPEGQGNTPIDYLNTNSAPYQKLLDEVKHAYEIAKDRHCQLVIPAFCWLQGENDITHHTGQGYKQKLQHFRTQFDRDVKRITRQQQTVKCILYQSCCLSLSLDKFNVRNYDCHQMQVPQMQMELVRDDENFCASGPVYPYTVVREYVHIDGISQKRMGYLEGLSLEKILRKRKSKGVTPSQFVVKGNTVEVSFNAENMPLSFDTLQVQKAFHYGFSVITPSCTDILRSVRLEGGNKVILTCSASPKGSKVRYGCNGDYWKSGSQHGPRGNLRDSQGNQYKCMIQGRQYRMDNWCYLFERKI